MISSQELALNLESIPILKETVVLEYTVQVYSGVVPAPVCQHIMVFQYSTPALSTVLCGMIVVL